MIVVFAQGGTRATCREKCAGATYVRLPMSAWDHRGCTRARVAMLSNIRLSVILLLTSPHVVPPKSGSELCQVFIEVTLGAPSWVKFVRSCPVLAIVGDSHQGVLQ